MIIHCVSIIFRNYDLNAMDIFIYLNYIIEYL